MISYFGSKIWNGLDKKIKTSTSIDKNLHIIDKNNSGSYRDDGLIFLRNVNGQKMDRVRKNVIKIFKQVGFKIEIQTHLKIVNFLDVTFNLANGIYRPYKKANEPLLYINSSSNHTPQVIKQLPTSISERLSNNS